MKVQSLILILFVLTSCYFKEDPTVIEGSSKVSGKASVSQVRVINNQLVIHGAQLKGVKYVRVQGNGLDETFTIESNSGSQIIANALKNITFGVGKVFNLVLSDAFGAATFQVDFSIPHMGAADGDVLMFNQGSGDWEPRPLNDVNLLGTWDASTNSPALVDGGGGAQAGDFYVVKTAGATTIDGINSWNVGDWIFFNGSVWEKLSNTSVVASFKGRQGVVVPMEADYTLGLLGDVDTTGAAAGKVLKFNGTQWVVGDDVTMSGGAVSGSAASFTGAGSQLTLGPDAMNTTQVTVDPGGFTTFDSNGTGTTGFNFTGGNVGVGTAAPAEELDVTGDIRASSSVIAPSLTSTGDLTMTADSDNDSVGALIFRTGPDERMRLNGVLNDSAGTEYGARILPTVNQSGTAGYTGLLVNVNATGTGSGTKKLLDLQLNGTSVFSIDPTGAVYSATATSGSTASYTSASGNQLAVGHFGNKTTISVDSTGFTSFTSTGVGAGYNFIGGNMGVGTAIPGEKLDVTGNVRASGSVKTPELSNTGDLTLMADSDNNASGALIFRTGPNERVRVMNNGNVGIGTSNPLFPLHIVSSGPNVTFDRYVNSTSANEFDVRKARGTEGTPLAVINGDQLGGIASWGHDGTNFQLSTFINSYADGVPSAGIVPGRIEFKTTNSTGVNSTNMTIKSNGYVGIGTTSPNTKLQVVGGTSLAATVNPNSPLVVEGTTANGNVNVQLIAANTKTSGLLMADTDSSSSPGYSGGIFYDHSVDKLFFRTGANATERLLIDSTGNVGIGTTAPVGHLHVARDVNASGVYEPTTAQPNVGGATGGPTYKSLAIGFGTTGDFSWMQSGNWGSGFRHLALQPGGGNVGVGVPSPSAKLEVDGQVVSQEHDAGAATAIDWNNGNVQITSAAPGALTFTNMLPGGSYVLVCTNAASGTFTFSHAGLTFRFKPANGATTASSHTIYNFFRAGNNVYVTWASGF